MPQTEWKSWEREGGGEIKKKIQIFLQEKCTSKNATRAREYHGLNVAASDEVKVGSGEGEGEKSTLVAMDIR